MNVGIVGAVLILIAWIPQTIKSLRDHGKNEPWSFILLYFIGTSLLVWHSISIRDIPFTLLNGVILVFTVVNIMVKLWKSKK